MEGSPQPPPDIAPPAPKRKRKRVEAPPPDAAGPETAAPDPAADAPPPPSRKPRLQRPIQWSQHPPPSYRVLDRVDLGEIFDAEPPNTTVFWAHRPSCDMWIKLVGKEAIPGHTVVLGSWSPLWLEHFFSPRWSCSTESNLISLEHIPKEVAISFLKILYSGLPNGKRFISQDNAFDIMYLAQQNDVAVLVQECIDFLKGKDGIMGRLAVRTLFRIVRECRLMAQTSDALRAFIRITYKTIAARFHTLYRIARIEMMQLVLEDVEQLLELEEFESQEDEFGLLVFVVNWVKDDLASREQYIGKLFRLLRLQHIPPKFLVLDIPQKLLPTFQPPTCNDLLTLLLEAVAHSLPGIDRHKLQRHPTLQLPMRTFRKPVEPSDVAPVFPAHTAAPSSPRVSTRK